MSIKAVGYHLDAYHESVRILASNYTTVVERQAAIHIRDEFLATAPKYVAELLKTLARLIAATDGEECAAPELCGPSWKCCRCQLRNALAAVVRGPTRAARADRTRPLSGGGVMRGCCHFCGKSVTTELPDDTIIRAVLVCPECIEARKVIIPDQPREKDQ